MRNILLFIFLTSYIPIIAGIGGTENGARSFGLAGNSSQLQDFWGVDNNPAILGLIDNWAAGISYKSEFLLENLSTRSGIIAYPTKNGGFGLSFTQFGYTEYNENRIGLSYGQRLSDQLFLGVQLNYLNTQLNQDYGNRSALSGNIGLLAKITEEVTLATTIINPNRAKLSEFDDERYPTIINLGLAYTFSEKVQLLSEVSKDVDYDANAKIGIEYQAIDELYFRAGFATNPTLSTFGFGLNMKNFQLDFASGFDSNLGFTPQLSLSYIPSKSEK